MIWSLETFLERRHEQIYIITQKSHQILTYNSNSPSLDELEMQLVLTLINYHRAELGCLS